MNKNMIGARIQQYRKKANYTQEKLSELVGLGSTYISSIERGVKMPKLETFLKISKVLNASPNELLMDYTEEGRKTTSCILYEELKDLTDEQYQLVINIIQAVLNTFPK